MSRMFGVKVIDIILLSTEMRETPGRDDILVTTVLQRNRLRLLAKGKNDWVKNVRIIKWRCKTYRHNKENLQRCGKTVRFNSYTRRMLWTVHRNSKCRWGVSG